jgi:L-fucose mutarotase
VQSSISVEKKMLIGIPKILSPDLLKVLMEMGHGDEIVIADGNFPSASVAQATNTGILVRADGHGVPELLDAILALFPLDQYVQQSVALMAVTPGDTYEPVIWDSYLEIVKKHNPDFEDFEHVERFAFYERAKKAYAVIATGESALYANIILKKGVVKE